MNSTILSVKILVAGKLEAGSLRYQEDLDY